LLHCDCFPESYFLSIVTASLNPVFCLNLSLTTTTTMTYLLTDLTFASRSKVRLADQISDDQLCMI
jgi:hypothetical protein